MTIEEIIGWVVTAPAGVMRPDGRREEHGG